MKHSMLALVGCALPISAYAIAATQEEVLCHSAQIVVADVISGVSADCRLQYHDCFPHDIARLTIKIVEVLAIGDDTAFEVFGAAMKDNKFTEAPHYVRTSPVAKNQTVEVSISGPAPIDSPLTDDQVRERFRRKRLLLSVSFGGGVLPLLENKMSEGAAKGPPTSLPSGSNLYAKIWPAKQREWIEKTIVDRNGQNCPKAAVIDGHSAITYKPPVTEADIVAEKLRMSPQDLYTFYEIGSWYYNGDHGLTKNSKEAALWYLKAAEQGNDLAERQIGEMFEFGDGVAPDHAKAVEWIRKALVLSPGSAARSIAKKHEGGRGYPKDLQRAEEWYRIDADTGSVSAEVDLGEFYEACGEKRFGDALKWYRTAAESVSASANHPEANFAASSAMSHLAELYATGRGVPKDFVQAAKWYQQSINAGGYWGQYGLALLYEQGLGVPKDTNKALELYYEVASLNDEARRRLFALYESGMNIPLDDGKAIERYRAAAERGEVRAQVGLGLRYKFHKGVERNWAAACALFNLASLSSSPARKHLPDFTGPAVTANIYMEPATWNLVHEMAKPGNLLKALDQFVAHLPPPANTASTD